MRKIMVGVLSVAGLLAVVLAVASGSATAQIAEVVKFTTDAVPGKYTVSWETQGGCDPTMRDANTVNATDGASGSFSRTVAVPGGTAPSATVASGITGETAEFAVVIASHCNYNWTGTYVSNLPGDAGTGCIVGARDGTITPVANAYTFKVDVSDCAVSQTIRVGIGPFPSGGVDPTYSADGRYLADNPTAGAILHSTFTVTATPVKDSDAECKAVTKETEINDNGTATANDDKAEVTLQLLMTTLEAENDCDYDIETDLPVGFSAPGETNTSRVSDFSLTPELKQINGEDVAVTLADCFSEVPSGAATGEDADVGTTAVTPTTAVGGDRCVNLTVAVADMSVYILQSVVGDAGGANARYKLTENHACGIPDDLPVNLLGTGGISTTPAVTVVELREGFYNISTAVMDPTDLDLAGRYRARRLALNNEADPCVVDATVEGLPDNCSAEVDRMSADLTTGVDAKGRAIMRFDIACSDHMDDMGGDMDDMGGDMEMDDGDMEMDGGDMEMDGDMEGPKPDVATG